MNPKLLIIFAVCILSQALYAQEDLKEHQAFFQTQLPHFQAWMNANQLNQLFTVKDLDIQQDSLVLRLNSVFDTDDSLKSAWEKVETDHMVNHRLRIGEEIFDQFAFLFQIRPEQAVIRVLRKDTNNTLIHIYHDEYLQIQSLFPTQMEGGTLNISLDKIRNLAVVQRASYGVDEDHTVRAINKSIKTFFKDYYREKGARWYMAHIDESRSYFNSFMLRITCLNKEIITDGYYEYIQIKVKVQQSGNDIQVSYNVYGAYASGIICPKDKDAFYKPIGENNYPRKMEDYAFHIEQMIDTYLRDRP